jgi:type III pantothenate kinase
MRELGDVLLVDIGNSRVKWAFAGSGQALQAGEPFAAPVERIAKAFERHWGEAPAPRRVFVSNVAGPGYALALERWTQARWNLSPCLVRSQAHACGVANGYTLPEKLGVDRWAALIGARHASSGAVLVADCGTAITLDLLDAEGMHLGGLIAPGLYLMRHALAQGTQGLWAEDAQAPRLLARDTAAAMFGGAQHSAAGLIERIWRESAQALALAPELLLTGGDAASIAAVIDIPHRLHPELVLFGLLMLAGDGP